MTRITLGRRIGVLEQAQPTTMSLSLRRWLGEPLTGRQHSIADGEREAINRFVGPPNLTGLNTNMQAWLAERGGCHAS
jgi:hypothetical protein